MLSEKTFLIWMILSSIFIFPYSIQTLIRYDKNINSVKYSDFMASGMGLSLFAFIWVLYFSGQLHF